MPTLVLDLEGSSMCCDLALVERLREGWLSQIGWKIGKNPNGLQPPLHIRKIMLQIFCNRYGRIYARRYEGQIIWNAFIWFPEMGTILGGGGGQLPFGTYPKNHPFWRRPHIWKSCACISYYLALVPPCIYSTISIIKNLQHDFPKMRGGSKAVWNFSEYSSVLVATPVPKLTSLQMHISLKAENPKRYYRSPPKPKAYSF